MQIEKRKHKRYTTSNIAAVITISPPPPDEVISLEGTVLDMSQKGIKIKLFTPLPDAIPTSKILINIVMPESGLPIKIRGSIRHIKNNSECGINYHQEHCDNELNELLFECIKVH